MVGRYRRLNDEILLAVRPGDGHYPVTFRGHGIERVALVVDENPSVVIPIIAITGNIVERLAVSIVSGQGEHEPDLRAR